MIQRLILLFILTISFFHKEGTYFEKFIFMEFIFSIFLTIVLVGMFIIYLSVYYKPSIYINQARSIKSETNLSDQQIFIKFKRLMLTKHIIIILGIAFADLIQYTIPYSNEYYFLMFINLTYLFYFLFHSKLKR